MSGICYNRVEPNQKIITFNLIVKSFSTLKILNTFSGARGYHKNLFVSQNKFKQGIISYSNGSVNKCYTQLLLTEAFCKPKPLLQSHMWSPKKTCPQKKECQTQLYCVFMAVQPRSFKMIFRHISRIWAVKVEILKFINFTQPKSQKTSNNCKLVSLSTSLNLVNWQIHFSYTPRTPLWEIWNISAQKWTLFFGLMNWNLVFFLFFIKIWR